VRVLEGIYAARTPISRELYLRARRVMPGGLSRNTVWHEPYPVAIVRGSGAYAWDADGNRYIDLLNNYSSLVHGHRHEPTVAAITDALEQGAGSPSAAPVQVELAEILVARVPSAEMIRFCNSGTEAVMLAVRVARAVTGRPLVLKATEGYHGSYDLIADGEKAPLKRFVLRAAFGDTDAFATMIERHRDQLAAVILEPILGSVVYPPRGFLRRVQEVTRSSGAALILDEVMTFRVAVGGAQSVFDVEPDLTILGKFVGGGIPIGAVAGKAKWLEVVNPDRPGALWHSGTFNGNLLAAHAGTATLKALDQDAIRNLNEVSQRVQERLQSAVDSVGLPLRVNRAGSLLGLADTSSSLDADAARVDPTASSRLVRRLHLALLNEGILLAPRGFGAISTALAEEHVVACGGAFDAAARLVAGERAGQGPEPVVASEQDRMRTS
jgi:glutamate-1-semialdehyde 2,1-aminomutase